MRSDETIRLVPFFPVMVFVGSPTTKEVNKQVEGKIRNDIIKNNYYD